MQINLFNGVTVSARGLLVLQLGLIALTGGFAVFLYGTMGPLLTQRGQLQAQVADVRESLQSLEQQRAGLVTEKDRLESDRARLRDEIARLTADRELLAASMRTLSASTDRTTAVVESAAAGGDQARPISPRVYVHVASDADAERAQTIVKALDDSGFIVPSVERVRGVPSRPQLRVFARTDQETAERALAIVRRFLPAVEIRRFEPTDLPGVRRVSRPGHLELWF